MQIRLPILYQLFPILCTYPTLPVTIAIFTSPMAFVTWISRGQASVQLYAV